MTGRRIAVIDIGKTNAKLALVDLGDLSEISVVTQPNVVKPGPPYPHYDVDEHWRFLLRNLRQFHNDHGVDGIMVTTHGAAAALIGGDGALATPIIDYEYKGPDELASDYEALRPPFSETGSPRLAMGLNVGAQLHYQFQTQPGLREATKKIVTYPQYWGLRLTGVAATDVTSLGTHTDLWNPYEKRFSSLVQSLGIADKMAPPRACGEVLGPILPDIAARTGLAIGTPVYCGIHDSNASLLPHLLRRTSPFSVVSTGTWVIAMAVGGKPVALDPTLDTLVNVNAFGDPVPSARFMGGREHDLLMGGPAAPDPGKDDIARVLETGVMLLPAVVPDSGPFRGRSARWMGQEPAAGSSERGVCTGFYLALVTARCLDLIGHQGPILVEGPFAKNKAYRWMLAAATRCRIEVSASATGTSIGAAMLALRGEVVPTAHSGQDRAPENCLDPMEQYARQWSDHLTA